MLTLFLLGSAAWASPCPRALCAITWWSGEEEETQHHLTPHGAGDELSLDVGEPSRGLLWVTVDERAERVVVRERSFTSVTVKNEGPHVDLTEWLHGTSEWREIPRSANGTWTLPMHQAGPFPTVDGAQIAAAVSEEVARWERPDPGWVERAETCANANSYPCATAVSRVELEVTTQRQDALGVWQETDRFVLTLLPAMGC
jgi:hypothetical protein